MFRFNSCTISVYICTVNWCHKHLYSKLVLCAHIQMMIWFYSDILNLKMSEGIVDSDIFIKNVRLKFCYYRYIEFENGSHCYHFFFFKFRYFKFKMANYHFVIVICHILDLSSFWELFEVLVRISLTRMTSIKLK